MKKRLFISLFLIFILTLCLGIFVGCKSDEFYSTDGLEFTDNGDYFEVTQVINSNVKDIVIPSMYRGKPVKSIGSYAFANCEKATHLVVPTSVDTISGGAFLGCSNLIDISLPTNLTYIGTDAFLECPIAYAEIPTSAIAYIKNPNLKSVYLKDGSSINSSAFNGCANLTSVYLPSSVTQLGNYVFKNCGLLTIYCEAENAPSSWGSSWNVSNCPVVWGFKGEE